MSQQLHRAAGMFLIRALVGIIFMMQGHGKVFSWGIKNMYENAFKGYEDKLPEAILWATLYYTTFVEMIGGFLLVIGLFRYWSAYALGIVLLVVSFGHGLSQPIWDLQHVFPRAVLLSAFLLLPGEWDRWHFDKK